MNKNYKVVECDALSKSYEQRYVVVSTDTGEILDDANGYGYKSIKNAYSAYCYKTRDKSKDKEIANKKKHIKQWLKEHKSFARDIELDCFYALKDCKSFKVDAEYIRNKLKESNLEIDFTPTELIKVLGYK